MAQLCKYLIMYACSCLTSAINSELLIGNSRPILLFYCHNARQYQLSLGLLQSTCVILSYKMSEILSEQIQACLGLRRAYTVGIVVSSLASHCGDLGSSPGSSIHAVQIHALNGGPVLGYLRQLRQVKVVQASGLQHDVKRFKKIEDEYEGWIMIAVLLKV